MKKIISIIVVVVVIALIAWGVWFFVFSKSSSINSGYSNSSGLLPSASSSIPVKIQTQTQSGNSVFVQNISSPQNIEVAKDFLEDIQNGNQLGLGGTVVSSTYALQVWGDANTSGEALLEYAFSTGGWTLISLGGGEWSALGLMQEGVPVSIAEQLAVGVMNGAPSSPAGSAISIPPGGTLAIGTAKGTVTMNNFYNNAAYIDQNEGVVLIQQSSTYDISYTISQSSFAITIFGLPFATSRQAAEMAFFTQLGISKGDACKLDVVIGVPYDIDQNPADHNLGLSFCSSDGSVFQAQ